MALYPQNPEQTAHSQSLVSYYCQEACHECPSLLGSSALVSPTCVMEPEHVDERYVQR